MPTSGYHSNMFGKFTEVVGLDIDQLLENSPFLLSLPIDEVKKVYEKRAENISVASEEYVDTCAGELV